MCVLNERAVPSCCCMSAKRPYLVLFKSRLIFFFLGNIVPTKALQQGSFLWLGHSIESPPLLPQHLIMKLPGNKILSSLILNRRWPVCWVRAESSDNWEAKNMFFFLFRHQVFFFCITAQFPQLYGGLCLPQKCERKCNSAFHRGIVFIAFPPAQVSLRERAR